jgi:hypothetical protein
MTTQEATFYTFLGLLSFAIAITIPMAPILRVALIALGITAFVYVLNAEE